MSGGIHRDRRRKGIFACINTEIIAKLLAAHVIAAMQHALRVIDSGVPPGRDKSAQDIPFFRIAIQETLHLGYQKGRQTSDSLSYFRGSSLSAVLFTYRLLPESGKGNTLSIMTYLHHHARRHGHISPFINQDESTCGPILPVTIHKQWGCCSQPDPCNVIG
jgi:hypothetical protein